MSTEGFGLGQVLRETIRKVISRDGIQSILGWLAGKDVGHRVGILMTDGDIGSIGPDAVYRTSSPKSTSLEESDAVLELGFAFRVMTETEAGEPRALSLMLATETDVVFANTILETFTKAVTMCIDAGTDGGELLFFLLAWIDTQNAVVPRRGDKRK